MYCRNCGNQMDPQAAFCVKCGVPVGAGNTYCPNCANATDPNAAVCVKCGIALTKQVEYGEKSKLTAGLLGIFLGALGIHNFYLGFNGKALAQLLISVLSCGAFSPAMGIWGLIEGIMILTGNINKDANGKTLRP